MIWYLLGGIGMLVVLGGAYMSFGTMKKQQHKEFEKRMPEHVASHPVSHNSILIWYIVGPIAAIVLGLLIVMISR